MDLTRSATRLSTTSTSTAPCGLVSAYLRLDLHLPRPDALVPVNLGSRCNDQPPARPKRRGPRRVYLPQSTWALRLFRAGLRDEVTTSLPRAHAFRARARATIPAAAEAIPPRTADACAAPTMGHLLPPLADHASATTSSAPRAPAPAQRFLIALTSGRGRRGRELGDGKTELIIRLAPRPPPPAPSPASSSRRFRRLSASSSSRGGASASCCHPRRSWAGGILLRRGVPGAWSTTVSPHMGCYHRLSNSSEVGRLDKLKPGAPARLFRRGARARGF